MCWPDTGFDRTEGAALASARVSVATVRNPPSLLVDALMLMVFDLAGIGNDFEEPGETLIVFPPTL